MLSLALCVLALLLAACGDDDSGSDGGSGSGGATADTESAAKPKAEEPTEGAGCKKVAAPKPKPDGGAKKPDMKLDPAKTWQVDMTTSCGEITIELDPKTSPNTSASFVSLARSGFYDGTTFHRIVPGFVIQGGDPTGTGTGGPGYSVVDTPPSDAAYTEGVVAMAKTGAEAPGTSGSQFYIVTASDAGLPPDYALLGKVTDGLDVVLAISELGDAASGESGTPLRPVVIEGMKVRES